MLVKTIQVEVARKSFPGGIVPPQLSCPSVMQVDVAAALLMLGQLTSPSGFSTASPSRYWAWLRYFSAISTTPDFLITAPFIDLDPHQKTILSDDFGVALTTMWLHLCLNGFSEIVDGRKFLLQFPGHVTRPKRKTPKVGIGKCPDYVVRDRSSRWHVLECKGTQSSKDYRNRQLASAQLQKQVIDIRGSNRGERLAAGIYLGNERDRYQSHLRIIDPEPQPILTLEDRETEMTEVLDRLATSRALALAGFDELASRIELPTEIVEELVPFYTSEERRALETPRTDLVANAFRSMRETKISQFLIDGEFYVGQQVEVRISSSDFFRNTGCNTVRVTQGVNSALIDSALSITKNHEERLIGRSSELLISPEISLQSDGREATLHESRLSAAKIEFLE